MKGRSRFRFRYRGIMSALGGIIDTTSKLLLDLFANDFEVANEVSTFNQTVSHSASTNGTMTGGYGPNIVAGQTWTISDPAWTDNGDGSFTGVSASGFTLEVAGILELNKVYQVEFEVYDYVSGTLDVRVGNSSPAGANVTSNGTYTVLQPQSGNLHFYLFPVSPFTGSVRNISVREMPAIKWRPHNLLTYSEDFSNAAWVAGPSGTGTIDTKIAAAGIAPDGTNTASRLVLNLNGGTTASDIALVRQAGGAAGQKTQAKFWVRSFDGSSTYTAQIVDYNGLASTINITGEWQLFENVSGVQAGVINHGIRLRGGQTPTNSDVADILIWGAHMYRSDLGGMVDNPDRGDSYVPTTSSAVYLPRRGHHIYNGYEWVNEGMLHESEARTNQVTYSEDFSQWSNSSASTAANATTSPAGALDATLITHNSVSYSSVYITVQTPGGGAFTASVYAKAGTSSKLALEIRGGSATPDVVFDLATGTVSGGTGTGIIEDVGNGWYRCSTTKTVGASSAILIISRGSSGTNGDTHYIWGAQLDEGSTPSSYIPTSGATVTRAAESLIIPAANLPWPTPNVIGSELVTNGGFDTDLTGWSAAGNWAWSSGVAQHTATAGGENLSQSLFTAGKVYQISWDQSGDFVAVYGDGLSTLLSNSNGTISKSVIFSSTSGGNITFRAAAGTVTIDNVSVKEIDPLSVSIQMNGRMTYADDDQRIFASWSATGNDLIEIALQDSVDRLRFRQAIGGVFDDVLQSPITSYSPGVFVPFNIASRHGSTFINGAVDGVALTADTTPTALPDLSTTDLNLGYDFMGTIQNFQIWDRDIGDQGLVDETAPSLEPSLFLTFDGTTGSYTVTDWSE